MKVVLGGGVLLIRIDEWDQVRDVNDKQNHRWLIIEVGEVLSNIVQRHLDAAFSLLYGLSRYLFRIREQRILRRWRLNAFTAAR